MMRFGLCRPVSRILRNIARVAAALAVATVFAVPAADAATAYV